MINDSSFSNRLCKLVPVCKRKRVAVCLPARASTPVPCRKGPALLQTELTQQTILSRGLPSCPQILMAWQCGTKPHWTTLRGLLMGRNKLRDIYDTCRSYITGFIGNLSKKTTKYGNVQKSSQSRDPKLAFFSEMTPYYFSCLRYLYSSNPVCPCPVTAVQLIALKGWQIPVSHPSLFCEDYKWAKHSPYCKGSWL